MRSRSDDDENPEKTTEWTAPIFAQASIATGHCGTIGMKIMTRSPFVTPSFFIAFASLLTSLYSMA